MSLRTLFLFNWVHHIVLTFDPVMKIDNNIMTYTELLYIYFIKKKHSFHQSTKVPKNKHVVL